MASKSKFISDFRSAVNTMVDGYSRVSELLGQMDAMGWSADTFSAEFASSDISADEFWEAVTAMRAILDSSKDPATATALAKLKP